MTAVRMRKTTCAYPAARALLACIVALAMMLALQPMQALAARGSWEKHTDTSWYTSNPGADTYYVNSAEQLAGLSWLIKHKGVSFQYKTIKLTADVDLSKYDWKPIGVTEELYVGDVPFKGTFNGGNHKITGLTIDNASYGQALFGFVVDATVKNFTVSGNVTCGWMAGGVCAYVERSTFENITSYVNVRTLFKSGDDGYSSTAGGIAAYVADTYVSRSGSTTSKFSNLKNYGSVEIAGITEQGGGVGGIVGSLLTDDDQTIELSNCENHGDVTAKASNYTDIYVKGAGGIVGSTATYGNYFITDCSNTGSVTSANLASTGGIAGSISGLNSSVQYCYNSGAVSGNSPTDVTATGGIVGRSVASHAGTTLLNLTSCYNVGTISGRDGTNISAILGSQSGFGEDYADTSGGITVNNTANFYSSESVDSSSSTGVLFQSSDLEAAQQVSADALNSQDVIDQLNSTDPNNDHFISGKENPELDLRSGKDVGVDSSSQDGKESGSSEAGSTENSAPKETHMYAVQEEDTSQGESQEFPIPLPVLIGSVFAAMLLAGGAIRLVEYKSQRRAMRPATIATKGN